MFAKETEEERQYKEKMDTVLDISMKEAMIQVQKRKYPGTEAKSVPRIRSIGLQVQKRSTPALKQKVFRGSVPLDYRYKKEVPRH